MWSVPFDLLVCRTLQFAVDRFARLEARHRQRGVDEGLALLGREVEILTEFLELRVPVADHVLVVPRLAQRSGPSLGPLPLPDGRWAGEHRKAADSAHRAGGR